VSLYIILKNYLFLINNITSIFNFGIKNSPYYQPKKYLGRKKWKSQGGYPTLTHGGLSLLEMAVPYLELSK